MAETNYVADPRGTFTIPDPCSTEFIDNIEACLGGGAGGEAGVGSPEGVVTAEPGTTYVDTTGTPNNPFWVKVTGSGNTGWVQLLA